MPLFRMFLAGGTLYEQQCRQMVSVVKKRTACYKYLKKFCRFVGWDICFSCCIARIKEFNLGSIAPHIHYLSPLGYLELMNLIQNSAFIITDSGGLQKESYYAGKRAIIIMPDTGWKELIDTGWNVLCPPDSKLLQIAVDTLNINLCPPPHIYGDGYSADIIIDTVLSYLNG